MSFTICVLLSLLCGKLTNQKLLLVNTTEPRTYLVDVDTVGDDYLFGVSELINSGKSAFNGIQGAVTSVNSLWEKAKGAIDGVPGLIQQAVTKIPDLLSAGLSGLFGNSSNNNTSIPGLLSAGLTGLFGNSSNNNTSIQGLLSAGLAGLLGGSSNNNTGSTSTNTATNSSSS